MLNKLFKNKKTRYRNLILVLLPFVILMFIFGFTAFKSAKNISGVPGENAFSDSIDSMDYHLRSNATAYQKELFKELNQSIKDGDKVEIAKKVVQNFVADFYTWTNKSGTYDIGGMYYVYSPGKGSIYYEARDGFYKYLSNYIEEYGQENLLEVESMEIVGGYLKQTEIDGINYDLYTYLVNWEYKENSKFDTSDFVSEAYFNVIENQDGRFEIIESFGE